MVAVIGTAEPVVVTVTAVTSCGVRRKDVPAPSENVNDAPAKLIVAVLPSAVKVPAKVCISEKGPLRVTSNENGLFKVLLTYSRDPRLPVVPFKSNDPPDVVPLKVALL
jgi:hypothetical protein